MQGSEKVHGAPLGETEIVAARENMGWHHPAFVIPPNVAESWREIAERGRKSRLRWEERLVASPTRQAFLAAMKGTLPADLGRRLAAMRKEHVEKATSAATRKASEMVLGVVNAVCSSTVGGSADLTHSNLTQTKDMKPVAPGRYRGRYIHYGIREHAMAAAMNGLSLHGGFIPYGGTFLTFSDYARGAIRLSALMGIRTIHVMTHDRSAWARTARPTSRSGILPCWGGRPDLTGSGPAIWRKRQSAGRWRSKTPIGRPCWCFPARHCPCCANAIPWRTGRLAAPTYCGRPRVRAMSP